MVQSTHSFTHNQALTCQSLHASRGGILLYNNVSFSLCEGATMAISADNGAGKTTLLKHIAGWGEGDGNVVWFEQPVSSAQDYAHDMLYIGDQHALYPDLTVLEQLHHFIHQGGELQRLDAAIHYMQLAPYLHAKVHSLSAGWKRRVCLMRLLLIPTLLWLLDEPTIHLDSHAVMLLGGLIHSHAERGGITILTMPSMDGGAPQIHNTPVSLLNLADFIPE